MAKTNRISKIFRVKRESVSEAGQRPDTQRAIADGLAAALPVRVNPLNVAAVFRCVNQLANSVSNLPLMYLRRRGDIYTPDTDSRLNYLLNVQPSENLNAVDFWRQLVQYVYLTGNAYVLPQWDPVALDWQRLTLLDPRAVAHDAINDIYTVSDTVNGVSGTFGEADIIHVKNYTRDGKHGLSTLEFARTAVQTAGTGDRETKARFENGGNVRGIVSNDTSVRGFGEYQDTELAKTARDIDSQFRDGKRIISLPGQAQFSPITLNAADMQFLGSRKFTVLEICRFFGVNPAFVYEDSGTNYKTAEQAKAAYNSNTLNPLLRKIENEFSRKLIAPQLNGSRRIEFDRRGILQMDPDNRAKYQAAALAAGIYTVNDLRREDNRPAVPDGDRVFVSANLKSLKELTPKK